VVEKAVKGHHSRLSTVTHKHVPLMVIGLHGSSTACALRVAEEVHSTGEEPAITQHLLVVENNVQGHLNKQTIVIHKHALSMDSGPGGACTENVL